MGILEVGGGCCYYFVGNLFFWCVFFLLESIIINWWFNVLYVFCLCISGYLAEILFFGLPLFCFFLLKSYIMFYMYFCVFTKKYVWFLVSDGKWESGYGILLLWRDFCFGVPLVIFCWKNILFNGDSMFYIISVCFTKF